MKRIFLVSIFALFLFPINDASAAQPEKREKLTIEQRAERRTKRLTQSLELTKDQAAKVYDITIDRLRKADEIKRLQREMHRDMVARMKEVLNEEQFEKLSEMAHPKKDGDKKEARKERRERRERD